MANTHRASFDLAAKCLRVMAVVYFCLIGPSDVVADHHLPAPAALPKAFVDGTGPGWRALGEADFVNVNCDPGTWTWKDGALHCTGQPVGVMRSKKPLTNFELVVEWNHRRAAGNSGVFVWTTKESLDRIKPGQLPQGMEVQMLDHGYATNYEKETGGKAEWFTTNGDVFGAGGSRFKPFAPVSPDGSRSFPFPDRSLHRISLFLINRGGRPIGLRHCRHRRATDDDQRRTARDPHVPLRSYRVHRTRSHRFRFVHVDKPLRESHASLCVL